MKKLIVVGVNHSGTAVINTVADNSKEWEMTVYESNTNCSFLGCGIALWMGNKIDDPSELFYSSPEALEAKGAKVFMEHKVLNVDFDAKKVLVKNLKTGEEFEDTYDKIVISTGSKPIDIRFDGIPLSTYDNVMGIKLYQDALHLFEKLKDPSIKHISIIGAGYIGVELAEAAKIHGKKVSLIDQSEKLLSNHYDIEFSNEMEKTMLNDGVELVLGQKVEGVKVENNNVVAINTDKGVIETDMVIVCVGVVMNTRWLEDERLEKIANGAIKVNSKQETSIADVYSIGDCATVINSLTGKHVSIALASNAVRSGKVAGFNIVDDKSDIEFNPVQGSNAISISGLNMVSTGLTTLSAEKEGIEIESSFFKGPQKLAFMKEDHEVLIKVFYKKESRVVVGAQLASTYDISLAIHMFSLAIVKHVTIDEFKFMDLFFLPHFNSPFNYINEVALASKKK